MKLKINHQLVLIVVGFLLLTFCAPKQQPPAMSTPDFVAKMKSPDVEVRLEALGVATTMGNDIVAPLGELLADTSRGVAKSACYALEKITAHRSRPKAGKKERAVFNDELLKILDGSKPVLLKQQILQLLAQTAGKTEVPQIAKLLSQPDLFESARWALERIPDPQSGESLLNYLKTAPVEQKDDIILTLGAKNFQPAIPAIRQLAKDKDGQVRVAAYAALAKLSDAESGDMLIAAMKQTSGKERDEALKHALRLADNLLQHGNRTQAAAIYDAILSLPVAGYFERIALVGLGKSGNYNVIPSIAARLSADSEDIRTAASNALVTLQDKQITSMLIDRYNGSEETQLKMGLLSAIAMRDAQKAQPLLVHASQASDLDMRSLALSLFAAIDSPASREIVLKAVESGPEQVRKAALHAGVQIADKIRSRDQDDALELYHLALSKDADIIDKRQALNGVAIIGSPESPEAILPLLYVPELSQLAARMYLQLAIAVAETGDFNRAEKMILQALGVTEEIDLANSVVHKMKEMGLDMSAIANQIGFVTKWWVAGPFPNENDIAEKRSYFPEMKIDFAQTKIFGDLTAKWQQVELEGIYAIISFADMFGRRQQAAYAYTEVNIHEEMAVQFKIGSNDGVVCWVNGWKVHENLVGRGLRVDQDVVDVHLTKGINRILLKIPNKGGNWQTCLRICDVNGVPLDLHDYSSES